MSRILCVTISYFLSWGLIASDWEDFKSYQGTLSRQEVESRLIRFLAGRDQGADRIQDHYGITDSELGIYASREDKEKNNPEFILTFGNADRPKSETFVSTNPDRPLESLRVALDPGHFGGELAVTEQRFVRLRPCDETGNREDIFFNEGELNLMTAHRLREMLEAQGAEVFLTHDVAGRGWKRGIIG